MSIVHHPILEPYIDIKQDLILLRNKAIKIKCRNVELALDTAIKCVETDAGRNLLK